MYNFCFKAQKTSQGAQGKVNPGFSPQRYHDSYLWKWSGVFCFARFLITPLLYFCPPFLEVFQPSDPCSMCFWFNLMYQKFCITLAGLVRPFTTLGLIRMSVGAPAAHPNVTWNLEFWLISSFCYRIPDCMPECVDFYNSLLLTWGKKRRKHCQLLGHLFFIIAFTGAMWRIRHSVEGEVMHIYSIEKKRSLFIGREGLGKTHVQRPKKMSEKFNELFHLLLLNMIIILRSPS